MKRIFMISVFVGLAVILFLGGAVIYQVNKLKRQTQSVLNQSLKDYSHTLEKSNIGFYFSPFECKGLFHVRCESSKAVFLRENTLLFSFSDLFLSLNDFDSQSLKADFGFVLGDVQRSLDLEDYFEILMPEKIKGSIKLTLESKTDILAETKIELLAKNLDYKVQLDSKLVSDNFRDRALFKDPLENLFGDPIRLIKMDLGFISRSLSPALFEVVKKQYGNNITLQDYQGLLAFMIALGKDQFSYSATMQQVIDSVGELLLGDKQQLHLSFVGQEEICLNCQPFTMESLRNMLHQSHIEVVMR